MPRKNQVVKRGHLLLVPSLFLSVAVVAQNRPSTKYSEKVKKIQQVGPRAGVEALKKMKPRKTGVLGFLEGQGEAKAKTESELVDMIKGFRFLIDQEKPGLQRDNYLLAEASGYLALSRVYRVKTQMSAKDREREKASNLRALKNTAEVFSSKFSSGEQQAKALFYGGLAQINLGDYEAARKSFLQSIGLNPSAPPAADMNLFVSENLFEKEKYEEALKQYGVFYKQYNNQQKALAIYKMGWSHLNLQRPQAAEKLLVLLAGQTWAGSFSEDAIKDLAFISSYFRSESEAIVFAESNFSAQLETRLQYLRELYLYFQNQSSTKKKPLLLNEILRLEKDPAKRMQILIATMKSSQYGAASSEPVQDLRRIQQELTDLNITPKSKVMEKIGPELETEVLVLVRSYADTLLGKVKAVEKINPEQLASTLIDLLKFHLGFFPESKERESSWKARLQVCTHLKNDLCTYETSHAILAEKSGGGLDQMAQLELLRSLDELTKKDVKFRDELIQRLTLFLNDQTNDSNWLALAKRLTVLLNQDKKYQESLPWLIRIQEIEKSSESKYRVLWVRYEMGQHAEIANEPMSFGADKFGEDTKSLVRESFLHLANKAKAELRQADYERNLKSFIELSDDSKKKNLGIQNLIQSMLDSKKWDEAIKEVNRLSKQERGSDVFRGQITFLANRLVEQDRFDDVEKVLLVEDASKVSSPVSPSNAASKTGKTSKVQQLESTAFEFQESLTDLAKARWDQFSIRRSRLSNQDKDYLDGVVALVAPKELLRIYEKATPETEFQRSAVFLALQINSNQAQPPVPPHLVKPLAQLGKSNLFHRPSTILTDYQAVVFPKKTWAPKKYDRFAQDAVFRVRRIRKRIMKDLENRPFEMQKQILEAAIRSEASTGNMITESPVPAELDQVQVVQYVNGLKQLSVEFSGQSQEFQTLLSKLQQMATDQQLQKISAPDMQRWVWSNHPQREMVRKYISEKQFLRPLIVIDQMKASGALSAEVAANFRSGILLSANSNQMMANQVKVELEAAGQLSILEMWKGLLK